MKARVNKVIEVPIEEILQRCTMLYYNKDDKIVIQSDGAEYTIVENSEGQHRRITTNGLDRGGKPMAFKAFMCNNVYEKNAIDKATDRVSIRFIDGETGKEGTITISISYSLFTQKCAFLDVHKTLLPGKEDDSIHAIPKEINVKPLVEYIHDYYNWNTPENPSDVVETAKNIVINEFSRVLQNMHYNTTRLVSKLIEDEIAVNCKRTDEGMNVELLDAALYDVTSSDMWLIFNIEIPSDARAVAFDSKPFLTSEDPNFE